MTRPDALAELLECCRDGDFYSDYDASAAMLAKASRALDALRLSATSPGDAVRAVLRAHWLHQIVCNHEDGTDKPCCSCSMWNCPPQLSIGAAVEAWIDHVIEHLTKPHVENASLPGHDWQLSDETKAHLKAIDDHQRASAATISTMICGSAALAPAEKAGDELVLQWRDGAPPKPWRDEWFIAQTTFNDRVVLTALPEEYAYDFKTADDTYIKADKIKRWMQFPDSQFIAPRSEHRELVQRLREYAKDWAKRAGDVQPVYDAIAALAPAERAGDDAEDEAYEIGKRDGYADAIQELDLATGGDGEFKGSTLPGGTVDVPAMKQRIISRICDAQSHADLRASGGIFPEAYAATPTPPSADGLTLPQLIEHHLDINTFEKNDDGSIVIDRAGMILTMSDDERLIQSAAHGGGTKGGEA